jgi:hypothetical protein
MPTLTNYMEHGGAGAAWDSYATIPAPPGTSLGAMDAQGMFAELANTLQLQALGIYTPWATRSGDTTWEEIKNPDTNVVLWALTDAQVNAVPAITYGSPLPFVAIVTRGPMTQAAVAAMWEGTAYRAYETQALYRQDDAKAVPTITFLHWGERIDMAELPKQTLALQPQAEASGGALVFAAQIAAQGSTTRALPATSSFQDALQAQLVTVTAAPSPLPVSVPAATPVTAAAEKPNLGLPIAVGLGAAVLGYMLWRKRR